MINLISLDTDGEYNSGFGPRNINVKGASKYHHGVDVTLKNDNIPAVLGGTVVDNGTNATAGNFITIKQSDGLTATYMHLAKLPGLSVGSVVDEGQTIGVQGNTGVSSGKHLHYQLKDGNGNYVNPETYFSSNGGLLSSGPVANTLDGSSAAAYEVSTKNEKEGFFANVVRVVVYVLLAVVAAFLFFKAFGIKLK